MQTFVPKYYFDFKCTADKCKHNCCIGWEIDIDSDTYENYHDLSGSFGERLARHIEAADGEAHFKLDDDERCPFLNKNNLCDIITELSKTSLCRVCKDHPRFRNFFDDRIEMGLGLTCEEAARIILSSEIKDAVTLVSSDGKAANLPMFPERFTIFDILLDSDMTLPEKFRTSLAICNGELPNKALKEWIDIYSGLELLDEEWKNELNLLKDEICSNSDNADIPLIDYANSILLHSDLGVLLTRLFTYFLYRHLADGLLDDTLGARTAFCVTSTLIIAAIFKAHLEANGSLSDEQILNISRMYSSEIEYSDENLDILINICDQY